MGEELATRIILPKMKKETENKMESKLNHLDSKIICEERIQYVSMKDLSLFQKSLNESIVKMEEDLKKELWLISKQLKDIPNVLKRLEKVETKLYETREMIAVTNQRLLLEEDKFELIEKKLENIHKDYNKKLEKCNNKVNSMKSDNDKLLEKLESNNTSRVERMNEQNRHIDVRFLELEGRINNIPNVKVIDIDTLQLKREIERLDEFIVQNKMGNNQINKDVSQKRLKKMKVMKRMIYRR